MSQRAIARECAGAFLRGPTSTVPLETLAARNIADLSTIENEIFGCDYREGKVVGAKPEPLGPPCSASIATTAPLAIVPTMVRVDDDTRPEGDG